MRGEGGVDVREEGEAERGGERAEDREEELVGKDRVRVGCEKRPGPSAVVVARGALY